MRSQFDWGARVMMCICLAFLMSRINPPTVVLLGVLIAVWYTMKWLEERDHEQYAQQQRDKAVAEERERFRRQLAYHQEFGPTDRGDQS